MQLCQTSKNRPQGDAKESTSSSWRDWTRRCAGRLRCNDAIPRFPVVAGPNNREAAHGDDHSTPHCQQRDAEVNYAGRFFCHVQASRRLAPTCWPLTMPSTPCHGQQKPSAKAPRGRARPKHHLISTLVPRTLCPPTRQRQPTRLVLVSVVAHFPSPNARPAC